MIRAKKPKKPDILKVPQNQRTVMDIVKTTNYVNMAIMCLNLWDVYGWRQKRINDFFEAYVALLGETADNRMSTWGFINYCHEKTGIDVVKLVDQMYKGAK